MEKLFVLNCYDEKYYKNSPNPFGAKMVIFLKEQVENHKLVDTLFLYTSYIHLFNENDYFDKLVLGGNVYETALILNNITILKIDYIDLNMSSHSRAIMIGYNSSRNICRGEFDGYVRKFKIQNLEF